MMLYMVDARDGAVQRVVPNGYPFPEDGTRFFLIAARNAVEAVVVARMHRSGDDRQRPKRIGKYRCLVLHKM